jgi:hypothetical protein
MSREPLAWKKNEAHKFAKGVGEFHDLGGQAATRSANGLILRPPLRRRHAGGPGR